jgi:hypothetical protein
MKVTIEMDESERELGYGTKFEKMQFVLGQWKLGLETGVNSGTEERFSLDGRIVSGPWPAQEASTGARSGTETP